MSTRPRPPVEELSNVAWARVERRLWAELDRAPVAPPVVDVVVPRPARARWPWLAAAALAAAAIVTVLAWPSGSRPVSAPVSRVVTAGAATEVSFGDAAINVAPESAILMQGHAEQGVAIVLERGGATFAVAARAGRPPFVVMAGAVQVRVVGTRFTVTRSGDDARVDVAHGEVEVVARGHREVLLDGASWSSGDVREAVVGGHDTIANPGDVAAAHFSPTAPPAPPRERPRAPERIAPAPDHDAAVAPPVPPRSPTTPAPPPPVVAPRRAAYEAAAALEVHEPAAALRAYRVLAGGKDAWAANGLYAAARLAFAQGDRPLAAAFAEAYGRRFPAGANAADARALLERARGGTR